MHSLVNLSQQLPTGADVRDSSNLFMSAAYTENIKNTSIIPAAPVILLPLNNSNITDPKPLIEGLAEPLAEIKIYLDAYLLAGIYSDSLGRYSFHPVYIISAGSHILYANTTDLAGNTSMVSAIVKFNIDSISLVIPSILPSKPPIPIDITNSLIQADNLLTPNSDGKNDTWIIKNISAYMPVSVQVFDLSGSIVMSSRNYKNDWDGSFRGAPLPQGTYYYRIEYGSVKPLQGFITLLRNH